MVGQIVQMSNKFPYDLIVNVLWLAIASMSASLELPSQPYKIQASVN